jgi:hypothetical protein
LKQILIILAVLFLTTLLRAQSPERMSYQAVIRNNSNNLITNTNVGMHISILQGSATGKAVYTETQTPSTNANGLVSIEIGRQAGFDAINWASGVYFIKTETDPTGGTNYTITGTSQLLGVPYAMYAKTSGSSIAGPKGDKGDPGDALDDVQILTDKTWSSAKIKSELTNKVNSSSLAIVATSGSYNDLYNKPAIFDGNYNNLINKPTLFNGNYSSLSNKPNIRDTVTTYGFRGNYNDLTNKPTLFNGQYSSLTGVPTFATVATSGSYSDLTNKPAAADGSETKVTAGTKVTVTGNGSAANPYVINATAATALTVGQTYQGGIIFWLDESGQHGLIVAPANQVVLDKFQSSYSNTNSVRDGIGAGIYNTERIIINMGTGAYVTSAAMSCASYNGGGYGDWYLPSKYELNLLYLQRVAVGIPYNAVYWSSTEIDINYAWRQSFDSGYQEKCDKFNGSWIRAIRRF